MTILRFTRNGSSRCSIVRESNTCSSGVSPLCSMVRTPPTLDFDLLPRSDDENLDRLAAALIELGAYLRVGGLTDDEARSLPTIIDGRSLRGMVLSTWRTGAGDVDVLRHLRAEDGVRVDFENLSQRALAVEVVGLDVHVVGLRDLIGSKRFAGRDKDLEVLPELERLLDEERP